MVKNFFSYGPKFDLCVKSILWMLFTMAILQIGVCFHNEKPVTPLTKVAVNKNCGLTVKVDERHDSLKLQRGDSITIYAYSDWGFLVETASGNRGYVDTTAIDSGGNLAERYKAYTLNKTYGKYMSVNKFERLALGKSQEELDAIISPAFSLVNTPDGKLGEYRAWLISTSTGCTYTPVVHFNKSGVADSIKYYEWMDRNSLLLRYLPFVSKLSENKFLTSYIETHAFDIDNMYNLTKADIPYWLQFILAIIGAIVIYFSALVWMCMPGLIPALLMLFLTRMRYPFYYVPTHILSLAITSVTVIGSYIWICMLMIWGAYFWIAIPLVCATAWYFIDKVEEILYPYTIPYRCDGCKTLYAIKFNRKETLPDKIVEYDYTGDSNVVGERTTVRKRWTRVTKSSGSYDTNIRTDTTTSTTRRYHHYHGKFMRHSWIDHYFCQCCGKEYLDKQYNDKLLEKRYIGSHDETTIRTT